MVDITTIGAGGGSIARVVDGGLTVGPESAGATPGPVCYGKGGQEPTVTDAHAALGHLPEALLGGAFALDRAAAWAAIEQRIAAPLRLDVTAAARGILDVANNSMLGAIRLVSIERGHDPRSFALMPFGGAGPLHGGDLARLIGCERVVVPPSPGVLSAIGLLASSLRAEFARTCLQLGGAYDEARLDETFSVLEGEARAWLASERVPPEMVHLTRQVSMRYEDQGSELTITWHGAIDEDGVAATALAFHRAHERLYGFQLADTPIEIVTLRIDAVGRLPALKLRELRRGTDVTPAIIGRQVMHLPTGATEAVVYDRRKLGAGAVIHGPAIIMQLDATTLVLDGQRAEVHPFGALVIGRSS
jgi:N-methylhydantoinase A